MLVSLLPTATAQFALQPVGNGRRLDPRADEVLLGYLAWNANVGTISWTEEPTTEHPGGGELTPAQVTGLAVGGTVYTNTGVEDVGGVSMLPRHVFRTEPTPRDLYINVTRPIQLDLWITNATRQPIDIELYVGDRFVTGFPFIGVRPTASKIRDWTDYHLPMQSEVDFIPKGSRLDLHLVFRGQGDPPKAPAYGLQGILASILRIPTYDPIDLEFRIPAAKTVTAPESGAPSGPALLGALVLLRGARGRRGLRATLVALLVVSSGCFGSEGPASDDQEDGPDRSAAARIVERRGQGGDPGRGDVYGVVHDDLLVPVADAHVSLAGGNFTKTDRAGRFAFLQLAPGLYSYRVDKAELRSVEDTFRVEANHTTDIIVTMVPLDPARDRRHPHDHWAKDRRLTLFEGPVEISDLSPVVGSHGACFNAFALTPGVQTHTRSNQCHTELLIPIGDGPRFNLVLPGTYEIEAYINWTDATRLPRAGLVIQPNNDPNPGNVTYLYPRGPGVPTHLRLGWEMTDVGHQMFTTWRFYVYVPTNNGGTGFRYSAQTTEEPFQVTLILHKGVVPLEPAHRDFWGKSTVLTVLDNAAPNVDKTKWQPLNLTPPRTDWVEAVLQFPAPTTDTWTLKYKPANVPPTTPLDQYVAMDEVSRNETRIVFRKNLKPEESDPYYATKSNFFFAAVKDPAGGTPPAFVLTATAHRKVETKQGGSELVDALLATAT